MEGFCHIHLLSLSIILLLIFQENILLIIGPQYHCYEYKLSDSLGGGKSNGFFNSVTINQSNYILSRSGIYFDLGQSAGPHAEVNISIISPTDTSRIAEWSFPASQGQDKLVLSLLKNKTSGFYVDLAARYWHKGSNTFALDYYYNWNGICIEPDANFYPGLVINRTCYVSCNNPISNQVSVEMFNYRLGNKNFNPGNENSLKVTVELWKILKKFNAPRVIDYLSLDIEGHERIVLLTPPTLSKWIFLIISIERPLWELHFKLASLGYFWLRMLMVI